MSRVLVGESYRLHGDVNKVVMSETPHLYWPQVEIPIILTVSIRLVFKAFQLLGPSSSQPPLPPAFFVEAPESYQKKDPPSPPSPEEDGNEGLETAEEENRKLPLVTSSTKK